MTVQARIVEFLQNNRNLDFCDDCIALRLGLKRRQQSQAATATLSETAEFIRESGTCSNCGEVRTVTSAK
jgi:hypothetical protein